MKQVIHILLIEDDTLDQVDVKRTLDRRNILHRLTIVTNGEEAVKLIRRSEKGDFPQPDIILLDLNMPKMNGLEVLEALEKSTAWASSKVFVLTTSDEKTDKQLTARYGVSGFITKPLKLESPSSLDAFNLMIDLMNL
jgi:CheY-like chemotaxis protein